ncbi:MBL fold metallo-hydrolase [Nonomuraea sp. NEAU-A123]|uniref:MBL fold metallo-hydrolase n=1 Tax=Nonomuraea sp. NEAU-A123 TaxID=2839649 RepID=UPI0027DFE631|nr:MBL fold metallo-hydrolase [Nonomuraea sp. NEAU-A123]
MATSINTITSAGPPRTEEIAPGVHAFIQPDGGWFVNNSGFLVTRDTVIVIDSAATEARTRGLRAAISEVSDRPVSTLINTHWHTDHTNGNYQFRGATIVAHERTREMMLRYAPTTPDPAGPFPDVNWGALEPAPPFLTYDQGVTVWADDVRCEVRWVGTPAHTTDDSIVWIPEHSVLYTGDLAFNGGAPLVSAGSVAGSLDVLRDLRELRPRTVVPGHGDVCGPEIFDLMIDYLTFVQDLAVSGHRGGRTPLRAARDAGPHPFGHLLDGERLVANLHRAYAEIDGAPRGAEIDLVATRRDMIALNGGRPLRCHA